MAIDDLYHRNPARDVEPFAVTLVQTWLGHRGTAQDTSAGHGPDFCIRYADGRVGWGEVAWHEDPELREMWSNVFRREQHQEIELSPGLGLWVVSLVRGANINQLYRNLSVLVDELARQGINRLEIVRQWPRGEPADTARRFGIEYINKVKDAPDRAVFFMPGSGGTVPTDPDVVSDWVTEMLVDPDYADTTQKLLALEADERHVFIMSGSRTPFGADERLRRLSDAIPMRPPSIPEGISHVWVVSQFGGGPAGLWIRGKGWLRVTVPPLPK